MQQELPFPDGLVAVYALGVRLSQSLILLDHMPTDPPYSWWTCFKGVLQRLSAALAATGDTERLLDRFVDASIEQLRGTSPGPTRPRIIQHPGATGDSTLQEILEDYRDWLINLFNLTGQDDLVTAHWFHLGFAVTGGTYDRTAGQWEWNKPEVLKAVLDELGLDIKDVYIGVHPESLFGSPYPSRFAGWANVDAALELLQNGSSGRSFPCGPDYTIPLSSSIEVQIPTHSDDFSFVNWYGCEYRFNTTEARCVKVMWEAAARGVTSKNQHAILVEALDDDAPDWLYGVFRNNAAWKKMIVPDVKKGFYKLSRPVPLVPPKGNQS